MKKWVLLLLVPILSLWAQIPSLPVAKPQMKAHAVGKAPISVPHARPSLKNPSSKSPYTLVHVFGPPSGHGKVLAMEIVDDLVYMATQKGLHIYDIADKKHPKNENYLWNLKNIRYLGLLDSTTLLAWREMEKDAIAKQYNGMQKESFEALDIHAPTRPYAAGTKVFYLYDHESACQLLHRKSLKDIAKKHHIELLNDRDFGYPRYTVLRGDDIYLLGTFGIAHFKHSLKNVQYEGGSTTAHAFELKTFFDAPEHLDNWHCKKCKGHCQDNFIYAGSYMVVGYRNVITSYGIFDRDLNLIARHDRPGRTAAAKEIGDDLYLFRYPVQNHAIVVDKIGREGHGHQMALYRPKQPFSVDFGEASLKIVGDRLFLYGRVEQANHSPKYAIVEMALEDGFRPKEIATLHLGSHQIVQIDVRGSYLYVLCDDALRIFRKEDE